MAFLTAALSALTSSSSSSSSLGCWWLLSLLGEILQTHQVDLSILFFTLVLHQCIFGKTKSDRPSGSMFLFVCSFVCFF